mmetsp:Transcript_51859/g.120618  ORF Transcript_51859/g.120618 Transcript_51859/m.120618 type:complete len:162 (+) Transcript_51859:3-488(+)
MGEGGCGRGPRGGKRRDPLARQRVDRALRLIRTAAADENASRSDGVCADARRLLAQAKAERDLELEAEFWEWAMTESRAASAPPCLRLLIWSEAWSTSRIDRVRRMTLRQFAERKKAEQERTEIAEENKQDLHEFSAEMAEEDKDEAAKMLVGLGKLLVES